MTQKQQTYSGLKELPPEPRAVPGCRRCRGLCNHRENLRSVGNFSGVTDTNVGLRQHHQDEHR
ncbi:hypothetical protein E2651_21505 [Streptomyces sp. MZ04]|nr:hypothetical protein E2651_21505 [Streptomyces sp. MZ04]